MSSFLNNDYDMNDPVVVSALDEAPLWSVPFGQKILDIVKMQRNLKVLDVGCGLGFPLIELSQRLGNSCQCFGIDPWKAAIQRARDKAKVWRLDSVDFCEGVAENLPFESSFFDLILSNNGLNNVENEELAVTEIARVCTTGGQLVITFNLPDTFSEFYHIFDAVLHSHNLELERQKLKEHIHLKRKPVAYWHNLLRQHGFVIQAIHQNKFIFRYVDAATFFNHTFIKVAFLPSWLNIVDNSMAEHLFSEIQKAMDKTVTPDKELVLTVPWAAIDAVKM